MLTPPLIYAILLTMPDTGVTFHRLILRTARRRRGMTQAEVAADAGISPSHYANIEQGLRLPSIKVLERIAAAVELSPDLLLVDLDPNCT